MVVIICPPFPITLLNAYLFKTILEMTSELWGSADATGSASIIACEAVDGGAVYVSYLLGASCWKQAAQHRHGA